ncbi:MAG: integrin alpha, partial [Planctomycetota bacterium]|nr:integrin alpha [Planctomycetota bacterium]
ASRTLLRRIDGIAPRDLFGWDVEAAGDVNGDGTPDIIIGANWNDAGGMNAGRAYIFLGTPPPPCPADLTGDGLVNAADLAALLGAWGETNNPADIDMSGAVNAADLGALLGAWGPCAN